MFTLTENFMEGTEWWNDKAKFDVRKIHPPRLGRLFLTVNKLVKNGHPTKQFWILMRKNCWLF